jgi:hypothetical protein
MARHWAGWLAVGLIALAFVPAYRATCDLQWPNEYDLYREMASARCLLQEGFGHDPCYAGERIWYNPLTHMALAALHRITGWTLPVTTVRGGTYLNLLGPVAFFLMAVVLLGRRRGLLALVGYLFCLAGSFPSWAAATYSPWLYPVNFAQGFFYLLILMLALWGWPRSRLRWALLTGLLLGTTFLAHTAPAMLFGGVFASYMVIRLLQAPESWATLARRHLLAAFILAGGALLVALPFLFSIVGHYELHIRNPSPNGYVPDFLGYSHLPLMILRHVDVSVLVAWLGLVQLIRGRCPPVARRILMPWLILSAAYLLYGYVVVGLAKLGVHAHMIVPSFHALFYFKAALSLLFALGVEQLARFLRSQWERQGVPVTAPRLSILVGALALLIALLEAPQYWIRYDYNQARDEALMRGAETNRIAVYTWLEQHGRAEDVVLASDDLSLFGIAPAGAKVVAVDPYLSSPYVDVRQRRLDRDRMDVFLAQGDGAAFADVATRYGVTYVVEEPERPRPAPGLQGDWLEEVTAAGPLHLHRVLAHQ